MGEGYAILLWKYFPNTPGRGTAFLSGSVYSLSHKECVHLKNRPILCVWLLWATPRFPRGTFSCISAVKGYSLEEFEQLLYHGKLYCMWVYMTWSEKFSLSCITWEELNSQRFGEDGRVCS